MVAAGFFFRSLDMTVVTSGFLTFLTQFPIGHFYSVLSSTLTLEPQSLPFQLFFKLLILSTFCLLKVPGVYSVSYTGPQVTTHMCKFYPRLTDVNKSEKTKPSYLSIFNIVSSFFERWAFLIQAAIKITSWYFLVINFIQIIMV